MNTISNKCGIILSTLVLVSASCTHVEELSKPNIIFLMADDQGWGQTGYNNHPILKTPHLDAMADNGLRFNRFYAGAANCSPTRASVMTGRSNDRTGVHDHGFPLRRQEKTIAQALKKAGYTCAHFGKWHLNGHRGPGVPIFGNDERNPGQFGFDEWLSVSNFFDMNPIMSRKGEFEEFQGESSHIIVNEAIKFIEKVKDNEEPLFIVIWFGSPHNPWWAGDDDKKSFGTLQEAAQNHYGELVSMDKSIGHLRESLRDMDIEENTLIWFNSDNGGVRDFSPESVGGLRGVKGEIYEGGLRVPAIIEWPAVIKQGRITDYPASTMDIFPTIAEIVVLPQTCMTSPIDGISIKKLFEADMETRNEAIPFRHKGRGALIDNNYKLVTLDITKNEFELYDLKNDPNETNDIINSDPETAKRMIEAFTTWNQSVESSIEGKDFPDGLAEPDPPSVMWMDLPEYAPYFEEWKDRPEYKKRWKNIKK